MRWILKWFLVLAHANAHAASMIETFDRFEINWTTLKFRFFGDSASQSTDEEGLKVAEKRAWNQGLLSLQDVVAEINKIIAPRLPKAELTLSDFRDLAKSITKNTVSYSTVYFADGTVRVILENSLPRSLGSQNIRFRQREITPYGELQYSGIGLRLNKGIKPSPQYTILDEHGETLFSVQEMAEDAYKKSLMGRWLKRPGAQELNEIIGKKPVYIDVSVEANGVFKVQRQEWDQVAEGHRPLLVNGVIALIQP